MRSKNRRVYAMATLFVLVTLCTTQADDAKATDEGKAAEFKGKTYDLKEGGKVAFKLEFTAGKKATITVKGEKQSDIHLFVYDAAKKQVAKDDSPGPDCLVTFTPKEAGALTIVVHNKGPGANRAAVKVAFPNE
jgi:hypothetical protein